MPFTWSLSPLQPSKFSFGHALLTKISNRGCLAQACTRSCKIKQPNQQACSPRSVEAVSLKLAPEAVKKIRQIKQKSCVKNQSTPAKLKRKRISVQNQASVAVVVAVVVPVVAVVACRRRCRRRRSRQRPGARRKASAPTARPRATHRNHAAHAAARQPPGRRNAPRGLLRGVHGQDVRLVLRRIR